MLQKLLIRTNILKKNSVVKGVIKGYNLETLPQNVTNILNNPIVRILRVIGGLSFLLSLLIKNGTIELPVYLILFINVIALIQLFQIVIVSIIKLNYGIRKLILNRSEFEVRNSPLNRIATYSANLIYCWKIGCQLGSSSVGLLGSAVLIDGILQAADQEKIFEPVLSKAVNAIIGTKNAKDIYKEFAEKASKLADDAAKNQELMRNLDSSVKDITSLVDNGVLTPEEGKEIQAGLEDLKQEGFKDLKGKGSLLSEEYKRVFEKKFEDSDKGIQRKE